MYIIVMYLLCKKKLLLKHIVHSIVQLLRGHFTIFHHCLLHLFIIEKQILSIIAHAHTGIPTKTTDWSTHKLTVVCKQNSNKQTNKQKTGLKNYTQPVENAV